MNSNRPYFPNDVLDVVSYPYPRFNAEAVCDWNLKLEPQDCAEYPELVLYLIAQWQKVRFDTNAETYEDGYGGVENDLVTVQPVYQFEVWVDEEIRWFFYKVIYTSKSIKLVKNDNSEHEGYDFDIEEEDLDEGVYKLTISYKSKDEYHRTFGRTACCKPLYEDAPHTGCEDNDGEVENNQPPCDGLEFNLVAVGNNLNHTFNDSNGGNPNYVVTWYYRENAQSVWSLLANNAAGVVMDVRGEYRAIFTVPNCGQYVRNYLNPNPCYGFDVRIRRNGNALIAELPDNFNTQEFLWEFNDGSGWTIFPGISASILAEETGHYRVTAYLGECYDQDIVNVTNAACAYNVDLEVNIQAQSATAITDAETPNILWELENENGRINIGSGQTVNYTETGILWITVVSGACSKTAYRFVKVADDCQKIEICNWDEMPVSQVTLVACCDDCPSVSLQVTCINRVLSLNGHPSGSTLTWSGPNGFTATGNNVQFPLSTPSGTFTVAIVHGDCNYTATYNYVKPNAGTGQNPIVL